MGHSIFFHTGEWANFSREVPIKRFHFPVVQPSKFPGGGFKIRKTTFSYNFPVISIKKKNFRKEWIFFLNFQLVHPCMVKRCNSQMLKKKLEYYFFFFNLT